MPVQESRDHREELQPGEGEAAPPGAAREQRGRPGSGLLCQIRDQMGLLEKCQGRNNYTTRRARAVMLQFKH